MPPLYPPTFGRPTLSPQEFVTKWRSTTLKERSAAQEHFIDLCRLLGHATPAEDRTGQNLTFEAGVTTQRGGRGWADVWKRGFFAWEYKGRHANLDAAYEQLLQYRESLLNPPLLVVSDLDQIVVHTNFTNTAKKIVRITLDDLLTPVGISNLRAIFYEPEAFRAPQTVEQVTEAAAREFGRLAELLRKWGEEPHTAARFLIRLLFCLFAEDVKLLPAGLFSHLISQTHMRPSVFALRLRQLFGAMAKGGWFGAEEIPYFNGGLFDDDTALELDSDGMEILARISGLDWSSIEPSILGTLFERSLDPSKRAQLGAHYTSRDDILLIVEPVLMAPLRRRWAEVQEQARNLATRRDAASGGQHTRLENDLRALLLSFQQEIASIRVLDPACGSGNFLYVALKQLLDLEKEVLVGMTDLGLTRSFPMVSPEQLYGIEINDYAHELAQATVWIGYIQWLRDNGFGLSSEPILKRLDTIVQMDAILAFDSENQAVEPDWPEVDVIIGNPPFLGDKKMRAELGDTYVEALRAFYSGRVSGQADFVTYWFERARALVGSGRAKRVGLLATNSIRQAANRWVLEHIKESGDIFLAWSDRRWILDGAAVRVSIVGFDDGTEDKRFLDGHPTPSINPDLTARINTTTAVALLENEKLCFLGMMKAGPFDIDRRRASSMLAAPVNPNGRHNSDVVKRRIGGQEVTGRPQEDWIIDFGVNMPYEEAAQYELPFEYLRRYVLPVRATNNRPRLRNKWWIHGEPRPGLRRALQGLPRYIATVEVAKHRTFVWIDATVVPDHTLHVIARADDYFFGMLHSHIHECWSLAQGARMGVGNDPRYSSTRTFKTFPFPWVPGQEPIGDPRVEAIASAARELVDTRDRWLNPEGASEADLKLRTLTNLYNKRPEWLELAHQKLDYAVLDAYGWPHDINDEEILERLLALNLERAAVQEGTSLAADASADETDE